MAKLTKEDKKLKEVVEKSKHLPSNLDSLYEMIVEGKVPASDLDENLLKPAEHHMDMSNYINLAMTQLGSEGMDKALQDVWGDASDGSEPNQTYAEKYANAEVSSTPAKQGETNMKISKNQAKALQKFPSLVEFLGHDTIGDKIAKKIIAELNSTIAPVIEKNSKSLDKNAMICESDRQNIKQYFKGDGDDKNWVCKVTANGPFSGSEGFSYDRANDEATIYRIDEDGECIDVTANFQIIHEYGEGDAQKED